MDRNEISPEAKSIIDSVIRSDVERAERRFREFEPKVEQPNTPEAPNLSNWDIGNPYGMNYTEPPKQDPPKKGETRQVSKAPTKKEVDEFLRRTELDRE